ncbi:hypothetical protein G7B40_038425 [Aetokthonos hydrillicola Thurmond2011]|jgi:hypothetical protein|uniref:site-specific DNA-methyltransferase (adenine-specific) n=1 Tax=Aetokthonos hydrillicola Thurmond2011 TaxID=2712845 RepID=A0AAP5IGQ8_9CYAN|nr:hypothetical protein [Aetokthonos hydrillicola]MBW4590608.1 hypothetical protein [Aetokthonos hydrillicola CCALA 1050]MDR9900384.1 hypothetical protein [Aetokthonos hydrillicola Thurmond2011]
MERNAQLLGLSALTGVVVPSAFHANEGSTGIRQLYLKKMGLRCCYSFENKRKLFEIHASFKFATVVAQRGAITTQFPCAFYLHDDEWLFTENNEFKRLDYTLDLVEKTGGQHLGFIELRSSKDVQVAQQMFMKSFFFGEWTQKAGIRLQKSPAALDISKNSRQRFEDTKIYLKSDEDPRYPPALTKALSQRLLIIHEGKTFRDFSDVWEQRNRYVMPLSKATDLPEHLERAKSYQLAVRKIASSTNERTIISSTLPPGVAVTDSVLVDATILGSPNYRKLFLSAIANSFSFDWIARQYIAANVNLYILENLPLAHTQEIQLLLSHSALRLTCNHDGYEPLWGEQLGETWRDRQPPFTFPVLPTDDERWLVRAAIDAVVADAYGLNREQYAHVLSTFSHKSYPKAPQLCLACFDELQTIGLEAFTKKYDPYL